MYRRSPYAREPHWGGTLVRQLEVVLPGRPENPLPVQFHRLLYGSSGNVGLDFFMTFWFDFRWLGLPLFVGLGYLYHSYYAWVLRGPKRLSRVVILLYAGLILGSNINILMVLIRGFLASLGLYGLLTILASADTRQWRI